MKEEKAIKYSYDQVGRLKTVEKDGKKMEFTYDSRGNRVTKKIVTN